MPKKSFLEKMGLVERSAKTDDPSILRRDMNSGQITSDATQTDNTAGQQSVEEKLQDLERRKRLLDDFNTGSTTFGFAGTDILEENKAVSLEDIIPSEISGSKTGGLQFDNKGMESEFAAAAELMKRENDLYPNASRDDADMRREREINQSIDELMGIGRHDTMNQTEGALSSSTGMSQYSTEADRQADVSKDMLGDTAANTLDVQDMPELDLEALKRKTAHVSSSVEREAEEVDFVDAGSEQSEYHTRIAEPVGDGLKVEENMKTSSFKADPYIGDKLDLIIGAYEKNKLLTIEEIYRNSRMETDTKKTIFMTDVFLQAIPANLPLDVKRETVLNILNISGIELETLLSDAYKRIDSLNKVHEDTISTSNDIYERNENTIRELERRIQDLRDINTARQVFQEDQNTMIEYEMQKIINLVEFVKPKAR